MQPNITFFEYKTTLIGHTKARLHCGKMKCVTREKMNKKYRILYRKTIKRKQHQRKVLPNGFHLNNFRFLFSRITKIWGSLSRSVKLQLRGTFILLMLKRAFMVLWFTSKVKEAISIIDVVDTELNCK